MECVCFGGVGGAGVRLRDRSAAQERQAQPRALGDPAPEPDLGGKAEAHCCGYAPAPRWEGRRGEERKRDPAWRVGRGVTSTLPRL